MHFGEVHYEAENRIATITLDRPQKFNAITANMPGDLEQAVLTASRDHSVHDWQ